MSDVGRLYRRVTRRPPPHIYRRHGQWLSYGGTPAQSLAAHIFTQRLNDERTPA